MVAVAYQVDSELVVEAELVLQGLMGLQLLVVLVE
jgi:hypothetical protein